MANSKGPSAVKSLMYSGRNPLLPPKSPFPSISPSYAEYIPNNNNSNNNNPAIGPKALPKPRDGYSHQRASSEIILPEEQPSWLDDLLNEPDTPVRRGHRRSSSDSFAYMDSTNSGSMNYVSQNDNKFKNLNPAAVAWGSSPEFDIYRDIQQNSLYADLNARSRNIKPWDAPVSPIPPHRGIPSPREKAIVPNGGMLNGSASVDRNSSLLNEKVGLVEDSKGFVEKKDFSHVKPTETDSKRAKQQFAQRSRVRKLQYIAELERNVQALQAEGAEVSAELEFLNQKNLILSMENKALKQRLENLAQEQLIKCLEHDVLEKEVGRLKNLYNQQRLPPPQQQQPISSGHRRAKSRDLDQQFGALSLKPKDNAGSVSGQLHI